MFDLLSKVEQDAYNEVIDIADTRLAIDGQRIKFSAPNLSRVQLFIKAIGRYSEAIKVKLTSLFRKIGGRLLDQNKDYYRTIGTELSSDEEARRLALLQWGIADGKPIPGGYIDQVFAGQSTISSKVAKLVNQAIAQRLSLKKFRDLFKGVFLAGPKSVFRAYFQRATYDLYQRLDRASNFVLAQRLGLKWAIYTGTIMETTRPFCESNVGKLFSMKQIEALKNRKWAGKNEPYDPYLDCGGYNCRHHWSFVSDEMAAQIEQQ